MNISTSLLFHIFFTRLILSTFPQQKECAYMFFTAHKESNSPIVYKQ